MALTGGCACGQVRYVISEDPMFTHACHCLDCQRTTGSAFVIHSMVPEKEFHPQGETLAKALPTGSGSGYEPHFCPECGTYVWCQYHRLKGVVDVRSGTLDDTNAVKPQAHIFTRSKQSWLTLSDDDPCFKDGYDRDETWPAESLKRFHEATGKL